MFALFVLETFVFFVIENLVLPAERRGKKGQKKQEKKDPIIVLQIGPIMLRNILGPVFNTTLDQLLTQDLFWSFFFWGGGGNPIFIVFSSNNAKFKETYK